MFGTMGEGGAAMAVIETSKLFDAFFKEKKESIVKKTRSQIDRPEVYAYEKKIGKQLVDMDADELFDMIQTFNDNRKHGEDNGYSINYNSYTQISSNYRSLFNFYIEKYEVIKNPWNNPKMRGAEAVKRLAKTKEAFTWETVTKAIKCVHEEYSQDKANYIECMLLLYYNGFAKAEEIVSLTEDMINFKTKEIQFPDRTIVLSDRCFELLMYVHNMTSLDGWRTEYLMVSYRNGYFKYAVRKKERKSFNDRPPEEIANMINRRIIKEVKNTFSIDINYRLLYLLGFYESLVSAYGKDRAKDLVLSVRNSEDAEDLMKAAKNYGLTVNNVSHLKRMLMPFI